VLAAQADPASAPIQRIAPARCGGVTRQDGERAVGGGHDEALECACIRRFLGEENLDSRTAGALIDPDLAALRATLALSQIAAARVGRTTNITVARLTGV